MPNLNHPMTAFPVETWSHGRLIIRKEDWEDKRLKEIARLDNYGCKIGKIRRSHIINPDAVAFQVLNENKEFFGHEPEHAFNNPEQAKKMLAEALREFPDEKWRIRQLTERRLSKETLTLLAA